MASDLERTSLLVFLTLLAGPLGAADDTGPKLAVRHALVDAYLRSEPPPVLEPEVPLPSEPPAHQALSPMLEGLEVAGPWLRLMDPGDGERQWERSSCAPERSALGAEGQEAQEPAAMPPGARRLCGLRWRKGGTYAELSNRLDTLSTSLKARMVGKGLAEHLELDVDSSPEIRFRWEFE